jgi:hypothetical protein
MLERQLVNERRENLINLALKLKEETDKILNKNHIEVHVNYCTNEFLTLKCPHCKKAFIDFSGCIAVQCKTDIMGSYGCGKYFCGICFHAADTSSRIHEHCEKQHGTYFLSIEKQQNNFKSQKIQTYIKKLSPNIESEVRHELLKIDRSLVIY